MKRNCIFIESGRAGYWIPVLFILLLCSACHHTEREFYPSGKLMMEKTTKGKQLDGVLTIWYESGIVKQKATYKNDLLDGKLESWYANGNKEQEESYSSGIKNGKSLLYDESGNLIEEKNFEKGVQNGSYKMWYPSGILKIEGTYRNGFFNGRWQYFSNIGSKVGEGNFADGTGTLVGYDSKGNKNHEVSYSRGKKQGNEIEYNADGSIKETKIFEQDRIVKVIKGN